MLIELSSHYYRPDFSAAQYRAVIEDFISDLSGYEISDIKTAISKYRRTPENRFFPHPGALIGLIKDRSCGAPIRHAVNSFKASDYATPENLTPLKPRQQIIDEHRAKRGLDR